MTDLTPFTLGTHLTRFVEAQIGTGRYRNASESPRAQRDIDEIWDYLRRLSLRVSRPVQGQQDEDVDRLRRGPIRPA